MFLKAGLMPTIALVDDDRNILTIGLDRARKPKAIAS